MNLTNIRGINSLVYSPTFCHSLSFVAEALDFSKPRIILRKQRKFSGSAPWWLFTEGNHFQPCGTNSVCPRPLLDSKRQSKPLQNANGNGTPGPRRGSDADSIVKTSRLSASAPEFVPAGMSLYDVSRVFTIAVVSLILIWSVAF